MSPKVSVIIPVYNGEKYIREAIDSVLNQTFEDFEIIVIDDGSTDSTPMILKDYGNKIRWKSQKNRGQASALNTGMKMAKGEYIAYLDADDICLPERLEIQVKYLDEHPDVGLVYADFYQIDENNNILRTIKSQPFDDFLLLQQWSFIARSTVMHRRACFDEVGVFDESITGKDDWDMWVRISERFEMGYIDQPLLKYRIHKESTSSVRPEKLAYFKYSHITILKKTYERREKPFWLRLKIIRVKVERVILKILQPLTDKFPSVWLKVWFRVSKVLDYIERILFRL